MRSSLSQPQLANQRIVSPGPSRVSPGPGRVSPGLGHLRSASGPINGKMGSPVPGQRTFSPRLLNVPPTASQIMRPNSRGSSISSFDAISNRTSSPSVKESDAASFTPPNLLPRKKTIELYRQNLKRSGDITVQFEFAQYLLQTALMTNPSDNPASDDAMTINDGSAPNSSSPRKGKGSNKSQEQSARETRAAWLKESITDLKKLSDRGYPDAQYLLGDAYFSGALGKPDYERAYHQFSLAAKHSHGEAAYRAALCLEEGRGCLKDYKKAQTFLKIAANNNQPGAMCRLGMAMYNGVMGFSNNVKVKQEGIKWLSRSTELATEQYPKAPYELAKIYEIGFQDIVFKDNGYAVQLYARSADLGYVPAAIKLGHAYEYGELDVGQDAALSIHYYTLGALKGEPVSMLAMCAWYMTGAEGVLERNEEEAYEWALRAAQAGLPKAQFTVGYFLQQGIGTERDILQSSNWYKKAAAAGYTPAQKKLDEGVAKMDSKHKGDCIIM